MTLGHQHPRSPQCQTGLSLVELIVAMTIGIIVVGGLVTLLSNSKTNFSISGRTSSIQENGRFATHILSEDIRLAKYWGLMTQPTKITVEPAIAAPAGECVAGWAWDSALPITGFNDINGYAGGGSCINNTNYSVGLGNGGTDILVIRHVDSAPVATASIVAGNYYLYSSVKEGMIFQAAANNTINGHALTEVATTFAGNQALTNDLVAHAYYIRPCSDPGGNGLCGDPGDDTIPTLVRETLQGAAVLAEPLVEYVEDMQIKYGADIDGNFSVDRYLDADQVLAPFSWDQIIAVRLELLVRASGVDLGYVDGNTYTLGDKNAVIPNDNFRRQLFSSTVFLRNQAIDTASLDPS